MCMLCVVSPGVIPEREKLENSALNNPHGFGFAIVIPEEHRIICERSMDADESINRFLLLREQYITGYAMWHARYATHGSRTVLNCHPFVVGNDERTYLAHNGILDIKIPDKDDRSDTRMFAESLLPAMGGVSALDNDHVWEMVSDYASGSKICILTVDPNAKHQCYLINESSGKEVDGVWWSNDSCYLDYGFADPRKGASKGVGTWLSTRELEFYDDEETVECPNCQAFMDEEALDYNEYGCAFCGYCFDCMQVYTHCMCYRPKAKKIESAGWGQQEW